jgi:hypothetical protein
MRRPAAALLLALAGGQAAFAQVQNTIAVPPAPPIVSAPITPPPAAPATPPPAPPPGLGQTPAAATTATTTPAAPPAAPDIPPPPETAWLPGNTATLGVLNKVDGSTAALAIPVGGSATSGDLQISVQSCLTRPPGQLPDAAVFITIQSGTDSAAPPIFRGWMIQSMPGATVAGNGGQSFRVVNCS